MNLAAGIALLIVALLGGLARQQSVERSNAVIYYQNGYTAQVKVINFGASFCPFNCGVRHRHEAHDIRWSCSMGEDCDHFIVFHVIYRGDENRIAALEKELRESDLTAGSSITVIASER